MSGQRFPAACISSLLGALLAGGCASGPVAQQIASSVATRVADKVVGEIVDAQLRREREPRNIVLKDTEPNPYYAKFLLSQFRDVPQGEVIVEPIPPHVEVEQGNARLASSRLVTVEVVNLVVGQEKQALLERGLHNGSTVLPAPVEWREWQLASGNLPGHPDTRLYFLVPPDFGRMNSGDSAVVEIAHVGGLHIARHRGY